MDHRAGQRAGVDAERIAHRHCSPRELEVGGQQRVVHQFDPLAVPYPTHMEDGVTIGGQRGAAALQDGGVPARQQRQRARLDVAS